MCLLFYIKNKRSLLSQFRCGGLPLATETGRYRQIPGNERYCTFCEQNAIEEEIHFLGTCNFYSKLRDTLFHNINLIEPTVVNISAMTNLLNMWLILFHILIPGINGIITEHTLH